MPYEPPTSDLRASDADREATVERLRVAGMEGQARQRRARGPDRDRVRGPLVLGAGCADARRHAARRRGWPPPQPMVFERPATKPNGLAIASIVAAVLWMWWLGSIAAVVMGHAALRQIARSGGAQSGRSVALAGLALGYIGLTGLLIVILFSSPRSQDRGPAGPSWGRATDAAAVSLRVRSAHVVPEATGSAGRGPAAAVLRLRPDALPCPSPAGPQIGVRWAGDGRLRGVRAGRVELWPVRAVPPGARRDHVAAGRGAARRLRRRGRVGRARRGDRAGLRGRSRGCRGARRCRASTARRRCSRSPPRCTRRSRSSTADAAALPFERGVVRRGRQQLPDAARVRPAGRRLGVRARDAPGRPARAHHLGPGAGDLPGRADRGDLRGRRDATAVICRPARRSSSTRSTTSSGRCWRAPA